MANDLLFDLKSLKQDLEFEARLGQSTHQTTSSSGAVTEKGAARPTETETGNELTAKP